MTLTRFVGSFPAVAVFLPVCLLSFEVLASSQNDLATFYFGAGLGYTTYSNIEEFYVDPSDTNYNLDDSAIGYGGFFGWEVIPDYVAIEISYTDYGDMEFKNILLDENGGDVNTYIDTYEGGMVAVGIAIKASFPVTESILVYGKLGHSEWEFDQTSTYEVYYNGEYQQELSDKYDFSLDDNGFFYVFGVEYELVDKLLIFTEYRDQEGTMDFGSKSFDWFDAQSIAAGVRWQFDLGNVSWRSGSNKRAGNGDRGLTACDDEFKDSVGGIVCQ